MKDNAQAAKPPTLSEWLEDTLPKLTKEQLINVMYGAVDEALRHGARNGVQHNIAVALGCDYYPHFHPAKYRVPKLSEVRKTADDARPLDIGP